MLSLTACGSKTILQSESKPVILAKDVKAEVYVKDEAGKLVQTTTILRAGSYNLSDPAEVVDLPTRPTAAEKKEIKHVFDASKVQQCKECAQLAKKQLDLTFKTAMRDMKVEQKREEAKVLAQFKACDQSPAAGDAAVPGTIPSAAAPAETQQPAAAPSFSAPAFSAFTTRNRVLLIGDNYPGTQAELHKCVSDVTERDVSIAHKLGFADGEMRFLLNDKATAAGIKAAVADWAGDYKVGDNRAIFLSSHGAEDTDESGAVVDLIVTFDMVATNQWNASTEVTLDWWHATLAALPPGTNPLIFFDCCHAGGAVKRLNSTIKTMRSLDGPGYVLNRVDVAPKRSGARVALGQLPITFIAACGPGQLSEETSDKGGVASWAFENAIDLIGPAKRGADYVVKMRELCIRNGFEQRPQAGGTGTALVLFR